MVNDIVNKDVKSNGNKRKYRHRLSPKEQTGVYKGRKIKKKTLRSK